MYFPQTIIYLVYMLNKLAPKNPLIIWFSNLLTMSASDDGYSRNTPCTL